MRLPLTRFSVSGLKNTQFLIWRKKIYLSDSIYTHFYLTSFMKIIVRISMFRQATVAHNLRSKHFNPRVFFNSVRIYFGISVSRHLSFKDKLFWQSIKFHLCQIRIFFDLKFYCFVKYCLTYNLIFAYRGRQKMSRWAAIWYTWIRPMILLNKWSCKGGLIFGITNVLS